MVRIGEARLGGHTVRSSVMSVHELADSESGKGEWNLENSSSTSPTVGTTPDESLEVSNGAPRPPQPHSVIVAVEPSSIMKNASSLASLTENDQNGELENSRSDGGGCGDYAGGAQTADAAPAVEAAPPQSQPPATASSDAPPLLKKSVSFHVVAIREYPRTLGDHPDTMMGPPITLAWEYRTPPSLGLDDYEAERGERRTKTQLLVHPKVRRGWLRDLKKQDSMPVTEKEMKKVEKEVHRASLQRRNSAAFHPLVGPVEGVVQSIIRKVKRGSWRSNDDRWWEKSQINQDSCIED